ncbi:hypothetical protein BHE74_00025483 [Ensete ventricosum]|nr:hypothetical protein BHE74_00025483 [Ensete ventricosum]
MIFHVHKGNEGGQDEADDMEPSSSCSSPGESSYKGEEWSLELTDDFSDIEGEVGKRLNQMVSIPVNCRCMIWLSSRSKEMVTVRLAVELFLLSLNISNAIDLLMVLFDCLVQYGVKIFVITSFKDTCYIEILPSFQKSKRGMSEMFHCRNVSYSFHGFV